MSGPLPDEELEPDDQPLWWTFRNQTVVGHALTVLAGWGVWMAVYWLHLSVVGGGVEQAAAGGPKALAARRAGIRVASAACWLWFSLAFTVGKGGPLLNVSLYPAGALVLGPYLSTLAFVGRLPPEMFTAASPTSGTFVVVGLGLFLPGFVLSLGVVGTFLGVITYVTGTQESWADRHMPDAYHEYKAKVEERERE
ncbi:MAG: hypothetical protein ABEH81_08470 [Halopenitus sp.]